MYITLLSPTVITTAGIFAVCVWLCVTAVYVLAHIRHDNSVMDIFYGPIFALSYWSTWYMTGQPDGVPVLIGVLLTLWALRLGGRIARKNWNAPEDHRYAAWRAAWTERGTLYFMLRSYLQINILQGIIIVLVAAPLWYVLALKSIPLSWLLIGGVATMLFGLCYEATADWQLDRFIARKKAGTAESDLMTSGLFRYSRRPNYFGEALVWWGFALIALSNGLAGWWVVVAPIVITYILTKVTGPMLEDYFVAKYPDAYCAYMASTNYFIPGPPR